MPGPRSPTLEDIIDDLNRRIDRIAVYSTLYGEEKVRLVFETDIEYIAGKVNERKEKVNKTNKKE